MAIEEFDIDEYDTDEELEEERADREIQEDDLNHAASMYVLRSQNRYLLREVYLQDMVLEAMADRTREIRRQNKLRAHELSQLRKTRVRNEKMAHARCQRKMNSITGYFYEFLKLTGQVDVVAREVEPDPVEHLEDFWYSVQQPCEVGGGAQSQVQGRDGGQ